MTHAVTWSVRQTDPEAAHLLGEELGLRRATSICLVNRGLNSPDSARTFLEPRLSHLQLPGEMADLEKGVSRVAHAVRRRERVGVFGDYDVDGVTSSALITLFLRRIGLETHTALADRFSGYGLTVAAVEDFAAKGCSLIVATDCGTGDIEAGLRASKLGVDVVVLDHHQVKGEHPPVHAFVNPQRSDCGFPDKTLAAVGLAFYFAGAVRTGLVRDKLAVKKEIDMRSFLDLVALGTVADVMPLVGNNRTLVLHGLERMSQSPSDGVQALLKIAKVRSTRVRADHIAYQLAPRLNAAGRLANAKQALDLLLARGRKEAEGLAAKLDKLSQERRVLEAMVLEKAREQIEKEELTKKRVIVVSGRDWHRGVLGIVAARLMDECKRPVYVIGIDQGVGTGSARSRGQLNLYDSLVHGSEALLRFGGHRDAAGFSVNEEKIGSFARLLEKYAEEHWDEVKEEAIECDCSLTPSEVNGQLVEEIGRLGPFGAKNPEPVFDIDGLYVLEKRVVGKDHLKLKLKTPTGAISAFGPRMAYAVGEIGDLVRVAASLTVDEWRGDGYPELRLAALPSAGD